jgi:hypothetical protein
MPRHADETRLKALRQAIEAYPGKRAGFFSRLLNWRREEVSRRLVSLNDKGVLLWEDDRGGLWPFKKDSV